MNKFDKDYIQALKDDPEYEMLLFQKQYPNDQNDLLLFETFVEDNWHGLTSYTNELGTIVEHILTPQECKITAIVGCEIDLEPLVIGFLKANPGGNNFGFELESVLLIKNEAGRFVYSVSYKVKALTSLEKAYTDMVKQAIAEHFKRKDLKISNEEVIHTNLEGNC